MTLKTKIAQILRKWADILEPNKVLDPTYSVMSPHFLTVEHEIQTLMVKREIMTYELERYGRGFGIDKRMKKEIADLIAKELLSHNSIKFTIEEKYDMVKCIGVVNIVQINN